jgi:hypothetical protein
MSAQEKGTYYAWAPILFDAERDDKGNILKQKSMKFGEEVSAGNLGLEEEQFQELVDSGAVRDYAPPEMPEGYSKSPRDFMMEQHNLTEGHIAGGYFSPDVIQQLQFHADQNEARTAADEEAAQHQEGKVIQKQPGAADAPKTAGATS